MCTVTWQLQPTGGYEVVFSRDEQRRRALAEPPALLQAGDATVLCPLDPVGGGTWLWANEHGVTAGVLNLYPTPAASDPPPPPVPPASRGAVLLALAPARDVADFSRLLHERLHGLPPPRPGLFFALDPTPHMEAWAWSGEELVPETVGSAGMLSTSSLAAARVLPARRRSYRDRSPGQPLTEFHLAANQPPDAVSVRMSRPDARTVSLTQVTCSRHGEILLYYADRRSDEGFAPFTLDALPLARVNA